MIETAIIFWFGLMNRLRGYDASDYNPTKLNIIVGKITNKFVTSALSGLSIYWLTHDWWVCLIVALGVLVWSVRGWGDYFDFTFTENNEQQWIDYLTRSITNAQLKDTIAMSLRGLYLYPAFVALAFYLDSYAPLVSGLGILLKGPVYWLSIAGIKHPLAGYKHALAEFLAGLLFGLLFILSL